MERYDIVIIGAGPGGYNAAIRAGQLGLKTAIIEKSSNLGGVCLNVGCIPSKALLHTSAFYEAARKDFAGMGIGCDGLRLDIAQMMQRKEEVVAGLVKGVAFLMKKNKISVYSGTGRFEDAHRIGIVPPADGKPTSIEAQNVIIATGSVPAVFPGLPFDEERILSSTGALCLQNPPEKMLVVGAGVIGLELGSVWRRLGTKLEVIEYEDTILPGMDSEISTHFRRLLEKQGMLFHLGHALESVELEDAHCVARFRAKNQPDKEKKIQVDKVLVAIGRKPYTEGLGLEKAGIKTDAAGRIPVDGQGRCAGAAHIYAVGDVISGPMLAHKAEEEGTAVAERIAGAPGHVDYNLIAGVVYTEPEVATIGLSEEAAKQQGKALRIGKFPFLANSRARANHETDGFVKLIAEAQTDRILGCHIIGKGAGELIAEVGVAMAFGGASEDIARICHAHPTCSEAVRQAAMAVENRATQM